MKILLLVATIFCSVVYASIWCYKVSGPVNGPYTCTGSYWPDPNGNPSGQVSYVNDGSSAIHARTSSFEYN